MAPLRAPVSHEWDAAGNLVLRRGRYPAAIRRFRPDDPEAELVRKLEIKIEKLQEQLRDKEQDAWERLERS